MIDFISSVISTFIAWLNALSGGNHFIAAAMFAGGAFILRRLPANIWYFILNRLTVEFTIVDSSVHDREDLIDEIINNPSIIHGMFSRRYLARYNVGTKALEVNSGLGWRISKIAGHHALLHISHHDVDDGYLRIVTIVTLRHWAGDLSNYVSQAAATEHDTIPVFSISESRWSQRSGNFQLTDAIVRDKYANQVQLINPEQYDIIHDRVERMVNDKEYYNDAGIAYKETFLLYGPPGTGKSSLVRHLACKFNIPIVRVHPSNVTRVREGMKYVGLKLVILLLDDVDEYLQPDEPDRFGNMRGINYMGNLINELDGIGPLNGCIVFINSNRPEALNSKLYRPGRVDVRMELTYPRLETVRLSIGWDEGDWRWATLVRSGIIEKLPLASINALRSAEDEGDVEVIINDIENYFKMAEASDATSN